MSIDWLLSRMCEEFNCTPDVAVDLPYGVALRIMMLRGYANARSYIEQTEDKSKLKHSPLVDTVLETQARMDIEQRQAQLKARIDA